jgi:hypothetical protein
METPNFIIEQLTNYLITQEEALKLAKLGESYGSTFGSKFSPHLEIQIKTFQTKVKEAIPIYGVYIEKLKRIITEIESNPQKLDQIMETHIKDIGSLLDNSGLITKTLNEMQLPIITEMESLKKVLTYKEKHRMSVN